MKNLFDAARVQEVVQRIRHLTSGSAPIWGKMTVSQMLAHCSIGIETATGEKKPPRMGVGRLLGPLVKPLVVGNDKPIRKNSPTAPIFIIKGDPEFETEQARLSSLVESFGAAGPSCCTDHPHSFFGRMNPDEWAILMYKHVDHHLRQFGV